MDWKTFLCTLLGLDPATATDEEIETAAKKKFGGNAEGLSAAGLSAAIAEAIKPMQTALDTVKAELVQTKRDGIIAAATAQGKVVGLAAPVIAKMSPEELQTHVDAIKATVPLNAVTPANVEDGKTDGVITEQQRTIALNCGMDPEKVYGKKSG